MRKNQVLSIEDIYQTLLKHGVPVYQTVQNCVTLDTDEYTVQVSAAKQSAMITVLCEDKPYFCHTNSFADAYTFLLRLSQGKIHIIKTDVFPQYLTVKNWSRIQKKMSPWKRITGSITGLVLTIFSLLCTADALFSVFDHTFLSMLSVISTVMLILVGAVLGISLIKHVNSKQPIDGLGVAMYVLGVLLVLFFTSLILGTWSLKDTEPVIPVAGHFSLTFCFSLFIAVGIWLIVSSLKNEKMPDTTYLLRKPMLPPEEQMLQLTEEISRRTRQECISLQLVPDRKPSLTDSKIGGVPYWNLSRTFPMTDDGHKLLLLAQINLSQLPENTMLPKEGMLQFFINDDETLGTGIQEGCQVIFHQTIDPSVTEADVQALDIVTTVSEHFSEENMHFPVSDEFAISFKRTVSELTTDDYRADELLHAVAEELNITLERDLTYSEFCEWFGIEDPYDIGHQMFGYCNYIDPRTYTEDTAQYDTLLFKLDSHIFTRHPDRYIEWYDSGSGYFFINHEKLVALDFHDVFYTWESY